MVSAMPKQRIHDPKTGKIQWREVDAPTTPPAAPAAPAAPSKPRAQRGYTATAPTEPPSAKRAPRAPRSDWDRLFDGAQDSADAES